MKIKMADKRVDGTRYKRCIGWHFHAGYGEACYDMCPDAQRNACSAEQKRDQVKEGMAGT